MQSGKVVVLHPDDSSASWPAAFLIATAELTRYSVLTAAVVTAGAIAVLLVLLLAVVAAPLAGALACWILWRSAQDGGREVRRLSRRARRRARALGLRVVRGALHG